MLRPKADWFDISVQAIVLFVLLVLVAFGFWQYVVVVILYDQWCRICDIRNLFREIKNHRTMDTADVARDIAMRLARSRPP